MNLKKKIIMAALAAGLSFGGLMAVTPTYAAGDWNHHGDHGGFPNHHGFPDHHGHGFPDHHYHHGNAGGAIAAGVIVGAAVGMMAAAAADHSCQRVFYTHNCHYDYYGYRHCYVVKHFRSC